MILQYIKVIMNKAPASLFRLVSLQYRCPPRRYSSNSPPSVSTPPSPKTSPEINVPGLSDKVLSVPAEAVGPGASKSSEYKNPEYFSYDKTSYFEAEIEMLKYRLPQPSSLKT